MKGKNHAVEKWTVFPEIISIGQDVIVLHHHLMMAICHAFIQRKEDAQLYCTGPNALALPDQSAHNVSVPVQEKGLAQTIIIVLEQKRKSWGFFSRS